MTDASHCVTADNCEFNTLLAKSTQNTHLFRKKAFESLISWLMHLARITVIYLARYCYIS